MILCMMRIPPHRDGHGGNQRAWLLVEALSRIDKVHLALVYQASDDAAAAVSLDPVRALVDGITVFPCGDWDPASLRRPAIPWGAGAWIDLARIGSVDAPRLPAGVLSALAERLPHRDYDTVFAARTSIAVIADALLDRGLIRAHRKIVDIDDIMSQFRDRQLRAESRPTSGLKSRLARANWHAAQRAEIAVLRRAENRVAASWDATAVCSDEDVDTLSARVPGGRILRLPNVVDRPLLPPPADGPFRLLFVGNLRFAPNVHGLTRFVVEAWPRILAACPDARLTVVGMAPPPALATLLDAPGIDTHANVPAVEPYYAAAHAVVSPIFFGGGTRIKILEALAFGRPVVSTPMGAEGLGLTDGDDILLGDTMTDFADAVVRLARDPALREAIGTRARRIQQVGFGKAAFFAGVDGMMATSHERGR